MKQKLTFLTLAMLLSFGLFAQETLITAWTFDDLAGIPNTPQAIPSNSDIGELTGTAYIYLDGTNGSSLFSNASSGNEINSFNGYTLNDPRPTAVAGKCLALVNNSANGKKAVFKLSTTGYANVVLTFVVRGTAKGFTNHAWEYSIDGTTFTSFSTGNTADNSAGEALLRTVDFSSVTAINDQENVYIRLTVDGANDATGNNRLDNIQIKGTQSGPDIYPPRLTSHEMVNPTTMKLTFNEALKQTVAETAANYSFEGDYNVTSAVLSDARFVTLTIDPALTEGDDYKLTISNIEDLEGNKMEDKEVEFTYGVSTEFHKATIAELRALAPEYIEGTNTGTEVYKYTGEAVITYMITNRNQKYIQDATGAILIDDAAAVMGGDYEVGDKITGFYGSLSNYYGMVQFVPTENGTTKGYNEEVTPEVIDAADLDRDNANTIQSKLVKVEEVTFSSSGNFATGTYYALRQNGTTYDSVIYTSNYNADYIGSEIPTYTVSLTGVVTYTWSKNRLIILNKSSIVSLNSYNPSAINLAPNPAADYVRVETGEAMQFDLFSITGQLVYREMLEAGTHVIPVSSFNAGIYIVKLTDRSNGKSHSAKLVIQ